MTSVFKNLLVKYSNTNNNNGTTAATGTNASIASMISPRTKKQLNNKALASRLERLRKQNSSRLAQAQSLLLSDISIDDDDDNDDSDNDNNNNKTTTTTTKKSKKKRVLSPHEQERKRLQDEIDSLTSQLVATKNELYETSHDWSKRFDQSQTSFQEKIQRLEKQIEQASNSILENELETLSTLQHSISTQLKLQEPTVLQQTITSLEAQLQEWQERYVKDELQWETQRCQLEDTVRESNLEVQDSKRQILWLEEELETIALELLERNTTTTTNTTNNNMNGNGNGNNGGKSQQQQQHHHHQRHHRHISVHEERILLLQTQKAQLEERLSSVRMENKHLQQRTRGMKQVQDKLQHDFQDFQVQSHQQEQDHYQQVLLWKARAEQASNELQWTKQQLYALQETRDNYRLEWTNQIEVLEMENYELRTYKQNRESEVQHERNLHKQLLEKMKAQLTTSTRREASLREQLVFYGKHTSSTTTTTSGNSPEKNACSSIDHTVMATTEETLSEGGSASPRRGGVSRTPQNNGDGSDEKIRYLESMLAKARARQQALNNRLDDAYRTVQEERERADAAEEDLQILKQFVGDDDKDDTTTTTTTKHHHDGGETDAGVLKSNGTVGAAKRSSDASSSADDTATSTGDDSTAAKMAMSMQERIANETAKLSNRRSQMLQRVRDCQDQIDKDAKTANATNTSLNNTTNSTNSSMLSSASSQGGEEEDNDNALEDTLF